MVVKAARVFLGRAKTQSKSAGRWGTKHVGKWNAWAALADLTGHGLLDSNLEEFESFLWTSPRSSNNDFFVSNITTNSQTRQPQDQQKTTYMIHDTAKKQNLSEWVWSSNSSPFHAPSKSHPKHFQETFDKPALLSRKRLRSGRIWMPLSKPPRAISLPGMFKTSEWWGRLREGLWPGGSGLFFFFCSWCVCGTFLGVFRAFVGRSVDRRI